ncbi:MAG: hypothetical protein OEO21_07905 [Candidatus Krumholzibacteria bacterium]|nr:hypothetical protein [Candidatus Krumholzibacteria bacterium]
MECEHQDGDIMGSCAICGDTVCGECVQTVFDTMICSVHGDLEDEGAWELVGFYSGSVPIEERRFYLNEQGLTSLAVEADDDVTELYVPGEEKEDAYAVLSSASEDGLQCDDCRVYYSADLGSCPVCGVRTVEEES